MKILINGKFLSQRITGVQRVAHELVSELDKQLELEKNKNLKVYILTPKKIKYEKQYKNIKIKRIGIFNGILWEQMILPIYSFIMRGKIVNLCNSAPIIKPDILLIHDVFYCSNPEFYNKIFLIYYKILNYFNIRNGKQIFTVSYYSKKEIEKYYKKFKREIIVIYNGWQHIKNIDFDDNVFKKFNIEKEKYILAVSSVNKNKNFSYIEELAKLYSNYKFVIVGMRDKSFINTKNIEYLGYVTDEELKSLYKFSKVFIHPSFCEGFGMTPLEAMASGCKNVYVSNITCLPEIFENSVSYLNPYKVEKIFDFSIKKNNEIAEILEKYSWEKAIKKLMENIT